MFLFLKQIASLANSRCFNKGWIKFFSACGCKLESAQCLTNCHELQIKTESPETTQVSQYCGSCGNFRCCKCFRCCLTAPPSTTSLSFQRSELQLPCGLYAWHLFKSMNQPQAFLAQLLHCLYSWLLVLRKHQASSEYATSSRGTWETQVWVYATGFCLNFTLCQMNINDSRASCYTWCLPLVVPHCILSFQHCC